MDVLWFRAGKRADENESLFARLDPGKMMVTFDRGDYWQCAYVIAKGEYEAVRARGLDAFRDAIVGMAPILKSGIADVKSWDDVKLLTVTINRLKRWTPPGPALHRRRRACDVAGRRRRRQSRGAGCGGDREPAGRKAVGRLSGPRTNSTRCGVRREFPVRMTQAMQVVVQNRLISAALKPGSEPLQAAAAGAPDQRACPGCRASPRGSSASGCAPSMCIRRYLNTADAGKAFFAWGCFRDLSP